MKGATKDEYNPEYLSRKMSCFSKNSYPQTLRSMEDEPFDINIGAKE